MNSFGKLFRITLFGESHGENIGVILDGCPAGIPLSAKDFIKDLGRRQPGAYGTTPRKETDVPLFKSGLFNERTTGATLTILFENKNIRSKDYSHLKNTPRPGHADFAAHHKYGGFNDYRGGGIFSGRLTVGLVAAGVVAKKILSPIEVDARLTEAGGDNNIEKNIQSAIREKDSIGGIIECRVNGLPIGLGEPFFDSTESLISHLVFAIPGIKGIEFGSGFACSRMIVRQLHR